MVIYAVFLKKRTKSESNRTFVCTKFRKDEFGSAYFHGIGYWHIGPPDKAFNNIDKEIEEIWIPCGNIDYIKNLAYKPKKIAKD